VTVLCNR